MLKRIIERGPRIVVCRRVESEVHGARVMISACDYCGEDVWAPVQSANDAAAGGEFLHVCCLCHSALVQDGIRFQGAPVSGDGVCALTIAQPTGGAA